MSIVKVCSKFLGEKKQKFILTHPPPPPPTHTHTIQNMLWKETSCDLYTINVFEDENFYLAETIEFVLFRVENTVRKEGWLPVFLFFPQRTQKGFYLRVVQTWTHEVMGLTLSLLMTTQEALLDSIDQDQTTQNF